MLPWSKKFILIVGLLAVSAVYVTVFQLIFESRMLGDSESFLFQIVVALMSTGVLALITGFMFIFQSEIESRSQNNSKVFETKLHFYQKAVERISDIAKNGLDSNALDELFLLTAKSMLVASPKAAEKLATLFDVFTKEESGQAVAFKEFVLAAREDLTLIDNLTKGHSTHFDKILETIENSLTDQIKSVTANTKRSWTNEQKRNIIKEYYDQADGHRYKWLRDNHNVTPAHISTWKTQINYQD